MGDGYPAQNALCDPHPVEADTPFGDAIKTLEAWWYTDEELARWLTAPQPLLDGLTPIQLLATGRKAELLNVVRALDDGAYL